MAQASARMSRKADGDKGLIVVVDDDSSFRYAARNLLRSVGHRVECCATVEEFLLDYDRWEPVCLILDVRFPGISGLELQRRLRASRNMIPIIFLTAHGDVPISVQAMKDGALEFLTKPFRDQVLLDAIQTALEHGRLEHERSRAVATLMDAFATLTARERQIMSYVARGLINKQIAADLELSEITVKVHRAQVMRKMGASTLADLVRMSDRLRAEGAFGA
jgi:FixJ family two-component response regulator